MSEINDILNLNEEILWKRTKVKNLVLIYPAYIIMIFVTIFLIWGLFYPGIIALTKNSMFVGYFLIISGIVLQFFLIFSMIFIFRKAHNRYRKILKVSNEELKEYKIINLLSNRRVIIKDVRRQSFKKKYVEDTNQDKNIWFIPNSVDTKLFRFTAPVENKKLKVGFIGRLEKSRGLDLLYDLVRNLPGHVEVHIIGAGSALYINRLKSNPTRYIAFYIDHLEELKKNRELITKEAQSLKNDLANFYKKINEINLLGPTNDDNQNYEPNNLMPIFVRIEREIQKLLIKENSHMN